jgi:hypothetical protein
MSDLDATFGSLVPDEVYFANFGVFVISGENKVVEDLAQFSGQSCAFVPIRIIAMAGGFVTLLLNVGSVWSILYWPDDIKTSVAILAFSLIGFVMSLLLVAAWNNGVQQQVAFFSADKNLKTLRLFDNSEISANEIRGFAEIHLEFPCNYFVLTSVLLERNSKYTSLPVFGEWGSGHGLPFVPEKRDNIALKLALLFNVEFRKIHVKQLSSTDRRRIFGLG